MGGSKNMAYLREKRCNLFSVDPKYYLAHCISCDCAMGKGIALEFDKKFGVKKILLDYARHNNIKWPVGHTTLVESCKVFNLFTKERFWEKPTYETMYSALESLRQTCIDEDIKYLAMPAIGCGLDKLQWPQVKEMTQEIFKDVGIDILVCYL